MRPFLAYSYGCIMAPIPEPVASRIRAVADAIPDEFIYDDGSGEKGREENIHITVKYGLHTSDPDEVLDKVSGWPPFQVTLGRTSIFHGDEDYAVLKLGVQSRDLIALNHYVSRAFEVTDTFPENKPHKTLVYMVKDPADPYYYREFYTDEFAGEVVEIAELVFFPAEGPKQIIPLEGTDERFQAMQLLVMARDVMGDSR
jgi:2'-5' RNA ligase